MIEIIKNLNATQIFIAYSTSIFLTFLLGIFITKKKRKSLESKLILEGNNSNKNNNQALSEERSIKNKLESENKFLKNKNQELLSKLNNKVNLPNKNKNDKTKFSETELINLKRNIEKLKEENEKIHKGYKKLSLNKNDKEDEIKLLNKRISDLINENEKLNSIELPNKRDAFVEIKKIVNSIKSFSVLTGKNVNTVSKDLQKAYPIFDSLKVDMDTSMRDIQVGEISISRFVKEQQRIIDNLSSSNHKNNDLFKKSANEYSLTIDNLKNILAELKFSSEKIKNSTEKIVSLKSYLSKSRDEVNKTGKVIDVSIKDTEKLQNLIKNDNSIFAKNIKKDLLSNIRPSFEKFHTSKRDIEWTKREISRLEADLNEELKTHKEIDSATQKTFIDLNNLLNKEYTLNEKFQKHLNNNNANSLKKQQLIGNYSDFVKSKNSIVVNLKSAIDLISIQQNQLNVQKNQLDQILNQLNISNATISSASNSINSVTINSLYQQEKYTNNVKKAERSEDTKVILDLKSEISMLQQKIISLKSQNKNVSNLTNDNDYKEIKSKNNDLDKNKLTDLQKKYDRLKNILESTSETNNISLVKSETEIEKIRLKLSEANEKINYLKSEKNSVENAYKSQLKNLKNDLKLSHKTNLKQSSKIGVLQGDISSSRKNFTNQHKLIEKSLNNISNNKSIQEATDKIISLKKALSISREKENLMLAQLSKEKKLHTLAEQNLSDSAKKLSLIKNKILNYRVEKENVLKENNKQKYLINDLNKKLSDLKENEISQSAQIKNLENLENISNKQKEEINTLNKSITNDKNTIVDLSKKINILQDENKKLSQSYSDQADNLSGNEEQLKLSQNKVSSLRNKIGELSSNLDEKIDENEKLIKKVKKQKQEFKNYKSLAIEDKEASEEKLEKANTIIQQNNHNFKKNEIKINDLINDLKNEAEITEKLKDKDKEKQKIISELNDKNTKLEDKFQSIQDKLANTLQKSSINKNISLEKSANLEIVLKDFENLKKVISEKKEKINELLIQLDQTESTAQEMKAENSKLKAKILGIKNLVEDKEKTISELQNWIKLNSEELNNKVGEIELLNKKLAKQNKEINDLKVIINDLSDKQEILSDKNNEFSILKKELTDAKNEISNLQGYKKTAYESEKTLSNYSHTIKKLQNNLAQKDSQINEITEKLKNNNEEDLINILSKSEKSLDQQNKNIQKILKNTTSAQHNSRFVTEKQEKEKEKEEENDVPLFIPRNEKKVSSSFIPRENLDEKKKDEMGKKSIANGLSSLLQNMRVVDKDKSEQSHAFIKEHNYENEDKKSQSKSIDTSHFSSSTNFNNNEDEVKKHDPLLGTIYLQRPENDENLSKIPGISDMASARLNAFGIYKYEQIASWTQQNVQEISKLLMVGNKIDEENWVEHAQKLAKTASLN